MKVRRRTGQARPSRTFCISFADGGVLSLSFVGRFSGEKEYRDTSL